MGTQKGWVLPLSLLSSLPEPSLLRRAPVIGDH